MKPLPCLFIFLIACLSLRLHARDLPDYRVGDVAETDITTPVALDVVDPAATAALQSSQARQYPAIFRGTPCATNEIMREFSAAFTQARVDFQIEATNNFHAWPLDEATIASANFNGLVTAFGIENKNFPITGEVAAEWARGHDGQAICDKWIRTLLWAENRRIRPDVLPAGMVVGQAIRVVIVSNINERLPLETIQHGELAQASSLVTVSNAQAIFRREFPAEQQLFARAASALIQPNCFPDVPLTQLTRGTAVCQLVVSDHYDSGDAIVRHGNVIDAKVQAALLTLSEKLKATPPVLPPQLAAASSPQPKPPIHAVSAPVPTPQVTGLNPPSPASKPPLRHQNLIIALTAVSVIGFMIAGGQYLSERKRSKPAAQSTQVPLPFPGSTDSDVAPQVTQAVREAVQQELASQRRELLVTQQAATDEITSLVHRLDELQVPLQERLHTYETRIQTLEKELALRDEENRQLLKMKIDMISRQLETERAMALVPPIIGQASSKN